MSSAPAARRLLGIVSGLLVLAVALVLWSSSLTWDVRRLTRTEPLPPLAYSIDGATAVPMTVALGLVALAAVVAALATGPVGRRLVGAAVLAVAIWGAVELIAWVRLDAAERTATAIADGTKHSVDSAPAVDGLAIGLAFVGVGAAVVAGVLLIAMAARFARMGAKYERADAVGRTSSAGDDGSERDREMWKSLDRGDDPTGGE